MRKTFSTLLSAALVAATMATGALAAPVAPASALKSQDIVHVRDGRNAALAAGVGLGVVGGLALGAAAANSRSNCDAYGNCYAPAYVAPPPPPRYYRSHRRGLYYDEDRDCWASRRTDYCVD